MTFLANRRCLNSTAPLSTRPTWTLQVADAATMQCFQCSQDLRLRNCGLVIGALLMILQESHCHEKADRTPREGNRTKYLRASSQFDRHSSEQQVGFRCPCSEPMSASCTTDPARSRLDRSRVAHGLQHGGQTLSASSCSCSSAASSWTISCKFAVEPVPLSLTCCRRGLCAGTWLKGNTFKLELAEVVCCVGLLLLDRLFLKLRVQ